MDRGNHRTSCNSGHIDWIGSICGLFSKNAKIRLAATFALMINPLAYAGDPIFNAPVLYPIGTESRSVASGDLNGDNAIDLITTSAATDTVSVLL